MSRSFGRDEMDDPYSGMDDPYSSPMDRMIKHRPRCGICHNINDDYITITPCNHVFCAVCINTWLQNARGCPRCKTITTYLIPRARDGSGLGTPYTPRSFRSRLVLIKSPHNMVPATPNSVFAWAMRACSVFTYGSGDTCLSYRSKKGTDARLHRWYHELCPCASTGHGRGFGQHDIHCHVVCQRGGLAGPRDEDGGDHHSAADQPVERGIGLYTRPSCTYYETSPLYPLAYGIFEYKRPTFMTESCTCTYATSRVVYPIPHLPPPPLSFVSCSSRAQVPYGN